MVGLLHLESSARPGDPDIAAGVGELATSSPEFRTWWAERHRKDTPLEQKRFNHPLAGRLTIDSEAFVLPDEATQPLFSYTGADVASQEAMSFLAVGATPAATTAPRRQQLSMAKVRAARAA